MIALGYLNVDVQGHGSLLLTAAARPLLRGDITLKLRKGRKSVKTGRQSSRKTTTVSEHQRNLWEQLRTTRKTIAEQEGIPAYVVFHDATLMEMMQQEPHNLTDMSQISGVGTKKLERYGQAFLDVIIQSSANQKDNYENESSWQGSVNLHRHGLNINNIALKRELSENTVYRHLAQGIACGKINLSEVVTLGQESLDEISKTIQEKIDFNQPRLKTVYEHFNGSYDYNILHCVLADLQFKLLLSEL